MGIIDWFTDDEEEESETRVKEIRDEDTIQRHKVEFNGETYYYDEMGLDERVRAIVLYDLEPTLYEEETLPKIRYSESLVAVLPVEMDTFDPEEYITDLVFIEYKARQEKRDGEWVTTEVFEVEGPYTG